MVQRAKADDGLEGTLKVTEADVWADFERALKAEPLLVNPGPEWRSKSDLYTYFTQKHGISRSSVDELVNAAITDGMIEKRRGKRGREKARSLYRVVKES